MPLPAEHPPSTLEIQQAYRLLLGREPENETLIAWQRADARDRVGLLQHVLQTAEFPAALAAGQLPPATASAGVGAQIDALLAALGPDPQTAPPAAGYWVDPLGVISDCSFNSRWASRGGQRLGVEPGDELEWLALLEAAAAASGDFCVVELGAGWGPWLARAGAAWRRRYPGRVARLIGVEGEPAHATCLVEHLRRNGLLSPRTTLLEGAVAVADGEVEFEIAERPADDWGTRPSTAVAPSGLPRVAGAERRRVPAHALSTLLSPVAWVDLLHLDLQGGEVEVLQAGAATLRRKVGRLFVGTHGRDIEAQLFQLLPPLGFRLEADVPSRFAQRGDRPTLVLDGGQYWKRGGPRPSGSQGG